MVVDLSQGRKHTVGIFREASFCLPFLLSCLSFLLYFPMVDYQEAAISTCQLIKKDHAQRAAGTERNKCESPPDTVAVPPGEGNTAAWKSCIVLKIKFLSCYVMLTFLTAKDITID